MIDFKQAIKKTPADLLITETDMLTQPPPYKQFLSFSAVQTKAVVAQISRLFAPDNHYNSVGPSGRVGKFQFNSQVLETLGFLKYGTVAALANSAGANARAINTDCNWTGQTQCNRLKDWLDNQGAQEQAILDILEYNYEKLQKSTPQIANVENNQLAGLLTVSYVFDIDSARNLLYFFLGINSQGDTTDSRGYYLSMYYYAGYSAYDFGTQVENA